MKTLTHLDRLEVESMHITREVVAEAGNPVFLYSVGKDSSVMLHLAAVWLRILHRLFKKCYLQPLRKLRAELSITTKLIRWRERSR